MILSSFLDSLYYVIADAYFWPSMAITVIIGLFIGSVLYDGCVKEVKKMIISLSTYALLIMSVISARVVPVFYEDVFVRHHPFSGIATVLMVTIFYLFGTFLGVKLTKYAHKGEEI